MLLRLLLARGGGTVRLIGLPHGLSISSDCSVSSFFTFPTTLVFSAPFMYIYITEVNMYIMDISITRKICKYLMNKKFRRRFDEIACFKRNTIVITRKLLNGRQLHKINTKMYSMLLESK